MIALNSKPKVIFEHIESESIKFSDLAKSISTVGAYYPNFKNWLYFTFRKEMIEGKRSIIIARAGNSIAGLSLLKHSLDEKKICTFYVSPSYRGIGVGHQLMDASTSYLGDKDKDKDIAITVAEERNSELYPLLKSKGFSIENKVIGYYRENINEYFYSLK
ncbi:MAG: GNAT family N-acetyltransferase [Methylococcales bacterium]|nr:GNAT family N-acetyltransferase [Methylococcales bacterium]